MRSSISIILCLMVMVTIAIADPIMVATERNSAQDDWALNGWVEELSCVSHSLEQLLCADFVANTEYLPCPTDYTQSGLQNVVIEITNKTDRAFSELYYVGDVNADGTLQTTFTNYDEYVADVTPGHNMNVAGLAFKIDRYGENKPLIYESILDDGIFSPGETWNFVIQEYSNTLGLGAHKFGSVGNAPYGAIAQASSDGLYSTGSIITPEPSTICVISFGALMIFRRR